jgi:uncharacterized protein YoxC
MNFKDHKKVIIYLISGLISIILFFLIIKKKPVEKPVEKPNNELNDLKNDIKDIKDNSTKLRDEFNSKINKALKNGKSKPAPKPDDSTPNDSNDGDDQNS